MLPPMRFSSRTRWELCEGSRGEPRWDLTETQPGRCGLVHDPAALSAALCSPGFERYAPDPRGLRSAREAISADHRRLGANVSPDRLLLAASTSELYGWLFKLLCDPGDAVLVPHPSYPLFPLLAELEGVRLSPYALEGADDFSLDRDALLAASGPDTRAVLVVSPANPTGRRLREGELRWLAPLCAERGWALIVDEVFADFALPTAEPSVTSLAGRELPCLTFALGGLSKQLALPQLKLGWLAASGPAALVDEALARLEIVADTYLSVNGPVQHAAAALLALGPAIRARISERLAQNRAALAAARPLDAPWDVLRAEGGWSAVLRLPAFPGEDRTSAALAEAGVLVHRGRMFDFPRGEHLVLSLLPEPERFAEGVGLLGEVLRSL